MEYIFRKKVFYMIIIILICQIFFTSCSFLETEKNIKHDEFYVKIKEGMTGEDIKNLLIEKKVIDSPFMFSVLAKIKGVEDKLQIGTYALHEGMEESEVLDILMSGRTSTIFFTIPEGFTVNDIAARLDEMGIISEDNFKKEARLFAPYDYIEESADTYYRVEGFLFPDTYEVLAEPKAKDILEIMTANFDKRLSKELREKAKERGISIYQLITLASLVEKEAKHQEDRAPIAQVFLKRLDVDMPLQSCATIQYLLDEPKEELLIQDTKIDSPYNTYQEYGLPPGPIANPGMAAIEAVLNPSNTEYLYFVADKNGKNYFSNTYADHLFEVEKVR